MAPESRRVTLPARREYIFELEQAEAISIKLVEGAAEVFGYELAQGVDHGFSDECRAAIFSWNGAEIEIGRASTEYIAEETPLPAYLNVHLALHQLRLKAKPPSSASAAGAPQGMLDDVPGPKVMIVGLPGSGKTTLAKTLVNWCMRMGRASKDPPKVLYANLDVSEGALTIPGTITLTPIHTTIPTTTPVHPLGSTNTSGPPIVKQPNTSALALNASSPNQSFEPVPNPDHFAPPFSVLSFFYGHTYWSKNTGLMDVLLKRAGQVATRKVDESGDADLWRGGMIVDTPGEFAERSKGNVVQQCVKDFGINVLIVVGSEKLYVDMSRLMSTSRSVQVVRVPKSGGASDPDHPYRRRVWDRQIRAHFHGGPPLASGMLSPWSIKVKFEDLSIYRMGSDTLAPSSALPIGVTFDSSDTQLTAIDPTTTRLSELTGQVLALLQAPDDTSDEEKAKSPVLGFIHLSSVDVPKRHFNILTSLPGKLPRKTAIIGTLESQDT